MRLTHHRSARARGAAPRRFAAALFGALALVLTAGCLAGTGQLSASVNGDDRDLELWTINLKKEYGDYIQGLVDGFERQHPDTEVTWVDVPGDDVQRKLLSAIAARKVPDVVNLTSMQTQAFAPALHDLAPFVPRARQREYIDSLLEPLRTNGTLIALPWYNGGAPVGVYNTELVAAAGLDPSKPPTTYDEALTWASRLHEKTPDVYGMNGIPDLTVAELEGVEALTADGSKAAFNTPKAAAVLRRWKRAFEAGGLAPGSTVKNDRNYPQTLDNRQVAFAPSTLPATLVNLEQNAPSVYATLRLAPAVTGSTGRWLIRDQQTFAVPRGSGNPQLATELALYLTEADHQTEFCKLVAIYPSTKKSLKDPHFTTTSDPRRLRRPAPDRGYEPGDLEDEARRLIARELPKLELGTLGTGVDDQLLESWREHVRAYLTGDVSAERTLEATKREWNKLLDSR